LERRRRQSVSEMTQKCPSCSGSGMIMPFNGMFNPHCSICKGSGRIPVITEIDKNADPILAGLSWMTVMNLKWAEPNGMLIRVSEPGSDGRFTGWILTLEGRPVVNTPPFDTAELATHHVHAVIKGCKDYESPKISIRTKQEKQTVFPFAQSLYRS